MPVERGWSAGVPAIVFKSRCWRRSAAAEASCAACASCRRRSSSRSATMLGSIYARVRSRRRVPLCFVVLVLAGYRSTPVSERVRQRSLCRCCARDNHRWQMVKVVHTRRRTRAPSCPQSQCSPCRRRLCQSRKAPSPRQPASTRRPETVSSTFRAPRSCFPLRVRPPRPLSHSATDQSLTVVSVCLAASGRGSRVFLLCAYHHRAPLGLIPTIDHLRLCLAASTCLCM